MRPCFPVRSHMVGTLLGSLAARGRDAAAGPTAAARRAIPAAGGRRPARLRPRSSRRRCRSSDCPGTAGRRAGWRGRKRLGRPPGWRMVKSGAGRVGGGCPSGRGSVARISGRWTGPSSSSSSRSASVAVVVLGVLASAVRRGNRGVGRVLIGSRRCCGSVRLLFGLDHRLVESWPSPPSGSSCGTRFGAPAATCA